MPRKRVVSRTLKYTKVTVLCVDVNAGETINQTYTITGNTKDDAQMLAKLKKEHETDAIKLCAIVDKSYFNEYREMTEEDFIKYSHKADEENLEDEESEE